VAATIDRPPDLEALVDFFFFAGMTYSSVVSALLPGEFMAGG